MGLNPFAVPEVWYRIRVFDHGLFIRSAMVPDRGQRDIKLIVKSKTLRVFGEETKLAFMINPNIPPKIMDGGMTLEVDFDLRDCTQMGDILDQYPDLAYEIDENFKEINRARQNYIDAKYEELTEADDVFLALSDPVTPLEQKTDAAKPAEKVQKKDESEDSAAAKIYKGAKVSKEFLKIFLELTHTEEYDPDLKKKVQKALDFCALHPKAYYFIPDWAKIQKEVKAVVWQSCIYQCGVMSSYYTAQSNAPIAEKIFTRPKPPEDWKTFAIMVIGMIAAFGLVVTLILAAMGKL